MVSNALSHHSPRVATWSHRMKGSTLVPASFVHCMSCVSHGSCLFGIWVQFSIYAPQIVFTWKPKKLRPVQMENHLPISRGASGWQVGFHSSPIFSGHTGWQSPAISAPGVPKGSPPKVPKIPALGLPQGPHGWPSSQSICVRFFLASLFRSVGHKIYV